MDMNHEWPVTMALLTVGLVMLAVFIHYEALNFLSRNLRRISEAPRPRILVLVPFILLTHVIEIWVFTAGYLLAMQLGLGTLAGDFNNTLQEVAYFSA
ncbi:MAG: two pore domain potassium channel family protein, partial [Gammaproteobacteria bacterium]|nr:two pore domain potassium channel family protein [Gammaproteobacteria bacterium]